MVSSHDPAASEALNLLLQMKGEFVWFVRISADNVLRLDFGSPHLKIREPYSPKAGDSQAVIDALGGRMVLPRGKWHLFVKGEWSVTTKFYTCNVSDTDIEKINKTLRQLDGQKLTDVKQSNGLNDWILEFDLGGSLHLSPSECPEEAQENEDGQWTLFLEDGDYLWFTNDGDLKRKGQEGS